MEQKKRPPITISELKGDGKEGAKSGSLSYISPKTERPARGGSSGINWTQVLVSCVISLALAAAVILQVAPSKGSISDLVVKTNELATRTNELATAVNEVSGEVALVGIKLDNEKLRVDNIIIATSGYDGTASFEAYSVSLNSLITKYNELSSRMGSMSGLITQYGNRVSQLQIHFDGTEIRSDIDSLQEALDELEVGLDIDSLWESLDHLGTGLFFLRREVIDLENRMEELE